jgi:hypothetical protein
MPVHLVHALDNPGRFLGCCRVIKVHEWFVVNKAMKYREIVPYFIYIKCQRLLYIIM